MLTEDPAQISSRLRIHKDVAAFETEQYLEDFFWSTVIPKMGLRPLARQYRFTGGICDILAIGKSNQLIIIELKNIQDRHIIEQIHFYFDVLKEEKPFKSEIDYSKPIELYTVCPSYCEGTALILKYHKLDFRILSYKVDIYNQKAIFTLFEWITKEEIIQANILLFKTEFNEFKIPSPPKLFLSILEKCSAEQKEILIDFREQIYIFSEKNSFKISEISNGKWIKFERTQKYSIAEIGWDNKRDSLAFYLWLPFVTINKNAYRTSMMRIWLTNKIVKDVGYVENESKSWLLVTNDELKNGDFSQPTKLNKWIRYGDRSCWKGLAMTTQFYLNTMKMNDSLSSLSEFTELALENSFKRFKKSKLSKYE